MTIEDGGGQVHVRGREALRAEFAELFGSTPSLRAEIVTRIDLGAYVVMEERVLRDGEADIRGVMIYHVAGDAIDRAIWLLAR